MQRQWWCAAALSAAASCASAQTQDSAFNPAVSLILQGTAATNSQDPNRFQLSGFAPTGGEVGPAPRSFSLGESELIVSSNIDPYFRGQLVAALTPDNKAEVEEAFFQTLALGALAAAAPSKLFLVDSVAKPARRSPGVLRPAEAPPFLSQGPPTLS